MIGLQAGLVRFVFIFGSPDIIPAACKDAGFGGKLHGNSSISMGDEVEFFLGHTASTQKVSEQSPSHCLPSANYINEDKILCGSSRISVT